MQPIVKTLGEFIEDALHGKLQRGWLWLSTSAIRADTRAMLLPDFVDERLAKDAGFTREGLDDDHIEQCISWACNYHDPPLLDDILRTFSYYLDNDAFPPLPGEVFSDISPDRAFYDALGAEMGSPCRHVGCARASVAHSVMCRVHHFEAITRRKCPFDD